MTATHHRTGLAATCSNLDPPVHVPGLWVNFVNAGPLERCDPDVHVYECGLSRLTWLRRVTVGLSWLVQHVYLAATCVVLDHVCQGCGSNMSGHWRSWTRPSTCRVMVKYVYRGHWMKNTWRNTILTFGKTLESRDGRYLNIALSIILSQCLLCNFVYLKHVLVLPFWLAKLTKGA